MKAFGLVAILVGAMTVTACTDRADAQSASPARSPDDGATLPAR